MRMVALGFSALTRVLLIALTWILGRGSGSGSTVSMRVCRSNRAVRKECSFGAVTFQRVEGSNRRRVLPGRVNLKVGRPGSSSPLPQSTCFRS